MSKKLLVVDDDESIRRLLEKLLGLKGYTEVATVDSGLGAMQHLLHHTPDAIFLDINMPEMDGWLLCEILTKTDRWKHIPIVFQSALIGADNIRRGITLGAHSYIEKPYTVENVGEVLHSIFEESTPKVEHAPAKIANAVKDVAEAAKHTFNLLMGVSTEVVEVTEFDASFEGRSYEFSGRIKAEGMTDIEISTGFVRSFGVDASSALTQLDEEDLDDPLIQDSLQEILNMMLGTAIRSVGRIFPVQLTIPKGALDAVIPYNKSAPHKYRVTLNVGSALVPLLVTIG